MTTNFFNEVLQKTGSRIAPVKHNSRFLLDKNEQSEDVDVAIKAKVLDCLMNANWNRYPAADYRDIETKIAEYCGLEPENIVLSAGSASIITTLLDFFALNKKRIIITQPSYSLFDYHCKTYNIAYEPWLLTPELEYDYDNMPELDANSVLIVTTPNNPVGNTIDREKLEMLLSANPESFIILDAVYAEFCEMDIAPLVRKYENLIVLRSFSKAFPIAGLRLGYLCTSPQTAAIIKKLVLQFSITHFSLIFAKEMLFSPEFMACSKRRVQAIIEERERMYRLLNRDFSADVLKVFKSQGNFLLMRIYDDNAFKRAMAEFEKQGIKVLNTSPFPLLQNTFRVSIGNPQENEAFLLCLRKSLEQNTFRYQDALVQLIREDYLMDKVLISSHSQILPRKANLRRMLAS